MTVAYSVRARDLTTDKAVEWEPCMCDGDYTYWEASEFGAALAQTGRGPWQLEVVEHFSGGGMPAGTRVVHAEDVMDRGRSQLRHHARGFFLLLGDPAGVGLAEQALGMEMVRLVEDDGTLVLSLVEYRLVPEIDEQLDGRTLGLDVERMVLAQERFDDVERQTAEAALFTAEAQERITAYERARRRLDSTTVDPNELRARARALADLLADAQARMAVEDGASMGA